MHNDTNTVQELPTANHHCEEQCSSLLPWGAKNCRLDGHKLLELFADPDLPIAPIRGVHWSGSGEERGRSSAQLWLMRGTHLCFLPRATDARTGPGMPNAFFSTWQEWWLLMPSNTSLQLKTPFFFHLKTVVQDRAKVAEFRFACSVSWLCICGQ